MRKHWICLSFGVLALAPVACSDDDGANVPRKGPILSTGGSGGSGAAGGSEGEDAGLSGSAGSAGMGGGGTGGSGMGGSAPACIPPDAGAPLDAGADASVDASADGGAPRNGIVRFEDDIWPLFTGRCAECHSVLAYAGHNVGSPDVAEAYDDAVRLGEELVNRLNGGGMPPECGYNNPPGSPGCFSVAELDLIRTWLTQCTPL